MNAQRIFSILAGDGQTWEDAFLEWCASTAAPYYRRGYTPEEVKEIIIQVVAPLFAPSPIPESWYQVIDRGINQEIDRNQADT